MPRASTPYIEGLRAQRRAQFLRLISAYSEDIWAAGWMEGIDQEIRAEGGIWIAMAHACGGWPLGYEAEGGWAALTEDELAQLGL